MRILMFAALLFAASGCLEESEGSGDDGADSGAAGTAGAGGSAGDGGSAGSAGIAGSAGAMGECTPGEAFPSDDGCNTCECPESGLIADAPCTERGCPDQCEPGQLFEVDCNTCECPESGLRSEAACTGLACPDPCEGRPCGAACSPEPPMMNRGEAPSLIAVPSHVCTEDGQCVPEDEAEMCQQPHPCAGLACGDSCNPPGQGRRNEAPDDGEAARVPAREYICDGRFDCVPVDEVPGLDCAAARCEDRMCGERCHPLRRPQDSDRHDNDNEGVIDEPAYFELCNADGQCTNVIDPVDLMCGEPPPPPGACDNRNCGDACPLDRLGARPGEMEGNFPAAPEGVCNPERICIPVGEADDPVCQSDPACENRECGSVCFPEEPGADPAPPGDDQGAPPPFRCNYEGRCADENTDLFCD